MDTNHGKIVQQVGFWEDSWCMLYSKHLGHFRGLAKPTLKWLEFDAVCDLKLEKVVPGFYCRCSPTGGLLNRV